MLVEQEIHLNNSKCGSGRFPRPSRRLGLGNLPGTLALSHHQWTHRDQDAMEISGWFRTAVGKQQLGQASRVADPQDVDVVLAAESLD